MKTSELRPCDHCAGAIAPLFYQVTVQTVGVNLKEAHRHLGLATFFGGGGAGLALANIMGPDPEVTENIGAPTTLCLCAQCYLTMDKHDLAAMVEKKHQ